MQLNAFGAVLRFALELEEEATRCYGEAGESVEDEGVRAAFAALHGEGAALRRRLERIRREQVNEMLLESIEGLDAAAYRAGVLPSGDDKARIAFALAIEQRAERFYRDAADRISIPEVVRSFTRLADQHAGRRTRLAEVEESLGAG